MGRTKFLTSPNRNRELDTEYLEECKVLFNEILEEDYTFLGLPVKIMYAENPDKAFDKFTIGGDKLHPMKTIDPVRPPRLHWIDLIFKHIHECDLCSQCENIKVFSEDNYVHYIYVVDKRYLMVLEFKKTFFMLISAHVLQNYKNEKFKTIAFKSVDLRK